MKVARLTTALLMISVNASSDDHERDWTIGVELSFSSYPQGHLGVPLGDDSHLAPALYGRLRIRGDVSWTFGTGLQSARGLSAWSGVELRRVLWSSCVRCTNVELYGGGGAQLGFVGPDYYQRHDNEFVGYSYAASGPVGVGGRVDAGVRLRWLDDRFETSLQVTDVVARPLSSRISDTDNVVSLQLVLGVRR